MLANLNFIPRSKPISVPSDPTSASAATPNAGPRDKKREKYKKGKNAIIQKRAARAMSKVDQITRDQVTQGLNSLNSSFKKPAKKVQKVKHEEAPV